MTKTTKKTAPAAKPAKTETEAPATVEVIETPKHEWGGKYAECKECGTTELKHYSGGSCTRCYTERRNERLGLGKFNPEMSAKRAERLEKKRAKLEADLAEVKQALKDLAKTA